MEQPLKVRASLRVVREDKLFGPGVAQLLEGVEQFGSLRRSAARMEMSYNKAWSVVHGCEEALGFAREALRDCPEIHAARAAVAPDAVTVFVETPLGEGSVTVHRKKEGDEDDV